MSNLTANTNGGLFIPHPKWNSLAYWESIPNLGIQLQNRTHSNFALIGC